MCGDCLERVSKTSGKERKQKELLAAPSHHADIAMIPSLMLLALLAGSGPIYWRNDILFREADIERHPGPNRAPLLRIRDVLVQGVLPTTALRNDVVVSEGEMLASRAFMSTEIAAAMVSPTVKTELCSHRYGCGSVFSVFVRTCSLHTISSLVHGRCRRYGGREALPQRATHLSVGLQEHFISAGGELSQGRRLVSISEWEQYCYGTQGNAFAFSES